MLAYERYLSIESYAFPYLPEAFSPFINSSLVNMPSWFPSNRLNRSLTLSFCWSTQALNLFLQASKLKDLARAMSLSLVRASRSCRCLSEDRSHNFCHLRGFWRNMKDIEHTSTLYAGVMLCTYVLNGAV